MAIWRRNQIPVREDDVAENAEVNMWVYRYGKISRVPAAFLKPVMQYNDSTSTGESLFPPRKECEV
jgi:hypothetical protein